VTFDFDGQRIGRDSGEPRDSVSGFLHEEKLRFKVFPAVSAAAVGVRDLPFTVAETPDRYVEGNYWTAIADADGGIAAFNRGTMGSAREDDEGFSIPLAYASHYIWGTRMLSGTYAYEFAVYPFSGSWREADLHRRALEYAFPVVAVASEPGCGELGRQVRALDITGEGAVLSALYTQDGHTFARLYEYRGEATQASLALVGDEVRLVEVDLSGQGIGPVVSPLPFRPWQIRTFRVEVDR
jgi:alpha-mannosidase